tara:strand:- start:115 stop:1536 length:1422 start_codon:yes stop_codon:yes gene_type:complete
MCGIFGIFDHDDAATITALGLHSLQHRGQEACGIVSHNDKNNFYLERRFGLVGDNFTKKDVIDKLPGKYAIGHNRYATSGKTFLRNVQPFFADLNSGALSIAHNGNLTNSLSLRRKLVDKGSIFQSTSDTEIIIQLIARSKRTNFIDKLIDALFQIQGGYSLVVMTGKKLIGVRDPYGIRPLVLGELDGSPILTSETCSLDIIGAKFVREIENGEIVIIDDGIKSIKPFPEVKCRPDIFEYIYFSRPDSELGGKSIYDCRKQFGIQLAKESVNDADLVTAVPDSGMPSAIGYAEQSKIPFELGLIRNHYVGRTFIEPAQQVRQFGVRLKHNANHSCIKGKKIILIDDSIVRGTTCLKIIQMLKAAGAKEIHMKVASPPIIHPDCYGVDTPQQNELLAANKKNIKDMAKFIGVSSLNFLSVEGLYKAMGCKKRNEKMPQFTDHCFTGDYPIIPIDKDIDKSKYDQLSFLSNVNL